MVDFTLRTLCVIKWHLGRQQFLQQIESKMFNMSGHSVRQLCTAKCPRQVSASRRSVLPKTLKYSSLSERTECPEFADTVSAEPRRTLSGLFRDRVSGCPPEKKKYPREKA